MLTAGPRFLGSELLMSDFGLRLNEIAKRALVYRTRPVH